MAADGGFRLTEKGSRIDAVLLSSLKKSLEEQMETEGRFIAECGDGREGVDAFLSKRPAKFTP